MPWNAQTFQERLRSLMMRDSNLLLLAAATGFLAGTAAAIFREMIDVCQLVFSERSLGFLGISGNVFPFFLPLMPMLGGLANGWICTFFPYAVRENGVHQVIQSVARQGGKIRKRTLLTCSTTSALTIGSGGSAGREGPTVQVGSAVGSAVGALCALSSERVRVLVGCGAAAGIAASFNTPLAGLLFALEVILRDFTPRTFSPIVIASVIGTVTGRAYFGNEITFQVPFHQLVSSTEIVFYLFLGILCGLAGRLFVTLFFLCRHYFDEKIALPGWTKPALGGLIVGLISIGVPQVLGNGYEFMQEALSGKMFWGLAGLLIILKMVATSITLGSGGMGGIFAPSLFIGAMVGTTFGAAVHGGFPDATAAPQTYSAVGMVAVAGAVMQAPLTHILMLFEMTNDYTLILPVMVCCIVAASTFRALHRNSIFIQLLIDSGIHIRHDRENTLLNSIPVKDLMSRDVTSIPENMPFRKILETVSYSKNLYFPVLDKQGEMTGILSFNDIREMLFQEELADLVIARELATRDVVTLNPENNLSDAMEVFSKLDVEQLPVVATENSRKPIGLLTRGDVIAAYNREILVSEFDR